MFKGSLGLALAAALALSAGAAGAQSTGESDNTGSSKGGAVTQPSHLAADMKGFNGAPDSLTTMISRIERSTGGRVIEIRFTNADGMPGYRAVVARGGQLQFLRIAATNGEAVALNDTSLPDWMLHWRDRKAAELAQQAKVPLADAIVTAEKAQDGAPALAAGVAASSTNPTTDVKAYNILVYRDGDVQRVAVDADTNQVIANPQALASWP